MGVRVGDETWVAGPGDLVLEPREFGLDIDAASIPRLVEAHGVRLG